MERFRRNKDGSYTDMIQHVPLEAIVEWYVKLFLFSNYLYYVKDSPILTDDHYDNTVRFLEDNYDLLPQEIKDEVAKGHLKTDAHCLVNLTPEMLVECDEWVARCKKQGLDENS